MATHSAAARAAATDAVTALVNGGSLVFLDGGTVCVSITLQNPAFSSADANGDATVQGSLSGTAGNTGTIDSAELRDSGGNTEATLTVGATGSGADIEIDDGSGGTAINSGDEMALDSLSYSGIT